MDHSEREAVMAAVSARVRSFEAAECARDADGLVAHYATVPEFYFYHDGRRATHDLMAAGVRKALPAVRSLDVTYADLEVSPLGSEYALASATFKRDIVMEGTGTTIRQQGGVSWLWRKIGAQWLIVQGHISHPLEPAK
ncbi:nuclear transport factor 2 family protein [Luteitalea pratensis]|nr:nuclear transport factor 2 family protein [Luteitalea pratensis]